MASSVIYFHPQKQKGEKKGKTVILTQTYDTTDETKVHTWHREADAQNPLLV